MDDLMWWAAGLIGTYLAGCAFWPYTRCPRCAGGKKFSPTGSGWRNCGRCGGSGKRRRVGAVLLGK